MISPQDMVATGILQLSTQKVAAHQFHPSTHVDVVQVACVDMPMLGAAILITYQCESRTPDMEEEMMA